MTVTPPSPWRRPQTRGGLGRGRGLLQRVGLRAGLAARLHPRPAPNAANPRSPLSALAFYPRSPLSVLAFHAGQARGGVRQAAPEAAGIPGLQGLVNQDDGRQHLHGHEELLVAKLLRGGGLVKGLGPRPPSLLRPRHA